ncbi:Glutathione S-transferase [Caenorhabditis elegans]|uniref:Glutathione S-transferase n=1 Tax=Caenorhabditis elegans TaxID=6239 RepID=O45115_CAEEL|nr:Glutathione S-transferase [Caenorhabditis elegans]CCD71946.1 Glutathione S-transferase [Caenorhabditis elegans]|eukprot:NP_499981.1 Glutathione S-Transferase [Caenorhabditis elegans]
MSPDQKHRYKLYYVNMRGRAEPIRLVFHFLGVDFEDYRMDKGDFTGAMKDKAPMKQLPFIEIDGGKTTLCQTVSICRYLAKSIQPDRWFGGATKTDSAKVDMMADGFADLFQLAAMAKYAPDPIKDSMMGTYKESIGPKLENMQDLLKKSKGEYFVGKSIHWCDVYILGVLQALDESDDGVFDNLPELREYYLRMRNLPELKEYIDANWPETKYKE